MIERCRLFLLIALGETVLTTGAAISQATLTPMTVLTGTSALAGSVALWSLIFGRSHHLIARHVKETCDPIRASRYAVNVMMVTVAGLIAVAVANKEMIAHPRGNASSALSLLLVGGPIALVAAQGWYLWVVLNVRSRRHLFGVAALLIVGLLTLLMPPYAALVVVGAGLTALAAFDAHEV